MLTPTLVHMTLREVMQVLHLNNTSCAVVFNAYMSMCNKFYTVAKIYRMPEVACHFSQRATDYCNYWALARKTKYQDKASLYIHLYIEYACWYTKVYTQKSTKVRSGTRYQKKKIVCCDLSFTHTLSLAPLADTNVHFAPSPSHSHSHANACTHSRWRHCCLNCV